jgi:hypothetical protein
MSPQGQTPSPYSWDRHDRLSGTGAIPLAPVRQSGGLYVSRASCPITGDDVVALVQTSAGIAGARGSSAGPAEAGPRKQPACSVISLAHGYTWSACRRLRLR